MKTKVLLAGAAVVVGAAAAVMMFNHDTTSTARSTQANALTRPDVPLAFDDGAATAAIQSAGLTIDNLTVRTAGDIVILRGKGTPEDSLRAVEIVKSQGATRIANLITPPARIDDEGLRRRAERELASQPGLHGTNLSVQCENGVVIVKGTVNHELQKDLARMTLRSLNGVKEVKIELASL
jgi:osmotically-inducible protein OsmY